MITCYSNSTDMFKVSSAPTAPIHPPSHPISRNLHSKLDFHCDRGDYGSDKKLRGLESVGRIFIFNLEAKEEVE